MVKKFCWREGRLFWQKIIACGSLVVWGCASQDAGKSWDVRQKLAAVGLELLSEKEACIPQKEAGLYVPCRVIPSFPRPALEPHPAGYLIVGANRHSASNADGILRALASWGLGESLILTVRRNPYLDEGSGWWEAEVTIRLPAAR